MKDNSKQPEVFTEQARTGIVRYGAVLISIHSRLVIEGYFLGDGKTWNIFKVGTLVCEFVWDD